MIEISFLDQLCQEIITIHGTDLSHVIVVLPNKRAKIFLIEAFKRNTHKTIFAPTIVSIEHFIQDITDIRLIDSIELLFEFYDVYLEIIPKEDQQSFEQFANWAKIILQDFNEIDLYLLDPEHVLSYLKNIEDIRHWSLDPHHQSNLIKKHLAFWASLFHYYRTLYTRLLNKGIGYQGLLYREAVKNLDHFSETRPDSLYIFAGFNALTVTEEYIIQHLLETGQAKVYWDIDYTFLEDQQHEVGYFIRKFKNRWKHYKTHPFEWISETFRKTKNIEIIGTPKTIGQARIAGNIIAEEIKKSGSSLQNQKTAIILGDENILIPLLYSLPKTLDTLNITMGYSAKNNPVQILINKLFKLHLGAKARDEKKYIFYYKDILDILTHPLVQPYIETSQLVSLIKTNNITFILHQKLFDLQETSTPFFSLLFNKWDTGNLEILDNLTTILLFIKNKLNLDIEQDKITKAFVYSIFKIINKLSTYFSKQSSSNNINTLYSIYKQIIDLAEVSFEGEPLIGLQIMGVLESRVLDFETVIITSVNEGKLPAGKTQNSFIPYDVRRELGLPTYKDKDAIYAYHFYHLLQRSKKIFILYNTESDGLDGGEKSRFITQLEIEKQENHTITYNIYNAHIPRKNYDPIIIPKSEHLMSQLREMCEKGFSPSSLAAYIRNPILFYFQNVLKINPQNEVEENIAVNTLGTIIHETLRALYSPYINKFLTPKNIEEMVLLVEDEVYFQFELLYKQGELKKGRNLLAFEIAKRNINNFLNQEKELLKSGDIVKIIALEQRFERSLEHSKLSFPVKLRGTIDRIEERNNIVRIIDYKTGKVIQNNITINRWDTLCNDIKNDKIIQILAYAYMYDNKISDKQDLEAGIISFKNLKTGFMPFTFIENKTKTTYITPSLLDNYLQELVILLTEILDKEKSFKENI